jgi:hypothetical protein
VNPRQAIQAAALAEAEAETAYRLQLARESFEAGKRAAEAELEAAWHAIADPASRGGPSWAAFEERRWGPGSRAHFADPRPGDFPGRAVQAEQQAEQEMEAGA